MRARTLYEFDNLFTAPLHGFRDTDDYWSRASAKPHLHRIRIPALVLNARNDPFVPAHSLPGPQEVGRSVTLWQPAHGGHVGFARGRFPGHGQTLPEAVTDWFAVALRSGMDAIVEAALRKWPNVPDCYGWLALDARGDWYLRDERGAGRRAVSAGQGQPHRTPRLARVHRAQLRGRCPRLPVLPERAAARLRRAGGRPLGVAADTGHALRHAHTHRGAGGLPQRLAG